MNNTIKIGKTSFNLEAFSGMKKEEFLKISFPGDLDKELAWTKIQNELNKINASTNKLSKKSAKPEHKPVDEKAIIGTGLQGENSSISSSTT